MESVVREQNDDIIKRRKTFLKKLRVVFDIRTNSRWEVRFRRGALQREMASELTRNLPTSDQTNAHIYNEIQYTLRSCQ